MDSNGRAPSCDPRTPRRSTWPLGTLLALIVIVVACSPVTRSPEWHAGKKIAALMDEAESYISRWGTVSMSEVIFIEDKGFFELKYDVPVEGYVERARSNVQGASAQLLQQAFSSQTALSMQPPGAAPPTATSPEITVDEVLSQEKFAALGALLGAADPTLSERDALLAGMSHKQAEQLVRYLVHPSSVPSNQKVYLGIGEVSLSPGWHTRKDYSAEVLASAVYSVPTKTAFAWASSFPSQAPVKNQCVFLDRRRDEAFGRCADAVPKCRSDATAAKRKALCAKGKETCVKNPRKGKDPKAREDTCSLEEAKCASSRDPLVDAIQREIASACETRKLHCVGEQTQRFERSLGLGREWIPSLEPHGPSAEKTCAPRMSEWIESDTSSGAAIQSGLRRPRILAVFPLLEAQTLDLRRGNRNQVAFATYLAASFEAAGVPAAAESINQYVRRLETDAATRTPVPIVSGFARESMFGYRFQPSFTALEDPAGSNSRSAHVLHPTTVPFFVVLVAETEELAIWSHVALKVSQRWTRLEARNWFKTFFVDWLWHGRRIEDLTNRTRLRATLGTDLAMSEIVEAWRAADPARGDQWLQDLRWRHRVLEDLVATPIRYTLLPGAKKSCSPRMAKLTDESVLSTGGWLDAASTFILTGMDLKPCGASQVLSVALAGRACQVDVLSNFVMAATCPALSIPAQGRSLEEIADADLIVTLAGKTDSAARAKKFSIELRPLQGAGPAPPGLRIQRDSKSQITGVEIVDAAGATLDTLARIASSDAVQESLVKACRSKKLICVDPCPSCALEKP